MKASNEDIDKLREIQSINQEIAEKKRQFEELPEKAQYVALSNKSQEIEDKLSQVREMNNDALKRYEKLLIEDSQLQEREDSVQQSIDEAAGDFRNLEVRTKELDGIASRRTLLADMILKVDEEQEKTKKLIETLEDAGLKVQSKMMILSEKIASEKQSVESVLSQYNQQLEDLFNGLPEQLSETYKRASTRVGSVVLSELEGDKCKVCRSILETGTLLDLEKEGNIGICPSCERILIINQSDTQG